MNDLFVRERADKEIRILAQLLEAKTELQEQALGRTGASKRMCLAEIKGIDRALGIVKKEMEKMIDIGKQLQDAFNDGYKQGKQDEWIPLKRKWPDRNGHYLVTYREWSKGEYLPKFDNTKVKILRYHEAIFRLPKCIDEKAEKDMCREVLAWMPLPEPYKEVTNEKNN